MTISHTTAIVVIWRVTYLCCKMTSHFDQGFYCRLIIHSNAHSNISVILGTSYYKERGVLYIMWYNIVRIKQRNLFSDCFYHNSANDDCKMFTYVLPVRIHYFSFCRFTLFTKRRRTCIIFLHSRPGCVRPRTDLEAQCGGSR